MSQPASVSDSPLPLEILGRDGQAPLTSRRQQQLIWALLAVGVLARAVRYFLKFPLWDDECFLLANLLDRGYGDLTRPLNYWQICPIGFLWIELTLVKLLGFSEYVLRLPSFVCGVAGLFIFRRMAGHLLRGSALVLAVGLFAVAYPLLRYSAEAKPYGIDMFLALTLIALAVEWWVRQGLNTKDLSENPIKGAWAITKWWPRSFKTGPSLRSFPGTRNPITGSRIGSKTNRWLWALAVLVPVAVLISYPVVFTAGGVSLFVAYVLWRERDRRGWVPWVVYNVALLSAFAVVFLLSVQPQSTTELDTMRSYWDRGFPPLAHPIGMVVWFFKVHTGQMLAYPFGGRHGGSALTFILCVIGLILLVRRRQYSLLLLLLAPLGLTFVAAALGRYPYGGMVRFNIYLAPAICLTAGMGLAVLLVSRYRAALAQRGILVATSVLAVVAVGSMARDIARPAKTAVDMHFRDFARWFWSDVASQGELVCLKSDLGKEFSPETFHHGFSAMYLCNQRIYSPRHARGESPHWDRISSEWPLRCVQFKSSLYEYDQAAFDRWMAEMKKNYVLVDRDSYPFVCYDKWKTHVRAKTYVEVYTFVPKEKGPSSMTAGRSAQGEKR